MADPKILERFIKNSGLKYKQNSVSYIFTCPRCQKKDKLYIRKKDGIFVCFYCRSVDRFQGKPEYALKELLGVSINEIQSGLYGTDIQQIKSQLDFQLEDFYLEEEFEPEVQLKIIQWPLEYWLIDHKHSIKGLFYLESRGFPKDIALSYGLRYSPKEERVIFPVEYQDNLYGWQGRTINPKTQIKYLGNQGLQRDRVLMFRDRLIGQPHCILTEGPLDAIRAHLCGGNVATMGKAVSKHQINILKEHNIKDLYLGLDPDAANELNKLVYDLNMDFNLFEMVASHNGEKSDLGAMTFEAVHDLYKSAKPLEFHKIFFFLKNR